MVFLRAFYIFFNNLNLSKHKQRIMIRSRYIQSLRNIPRVARYLAHFILFLIKMGVDANQIHLIGFSLGADVAGYAGRVLKAWNHQMSRITG